MITKKELTNRFSTIEINSNEIELMTSHTVYEKNEDKKDVVISSSASPVSFSACLAVVLY